MPPRVQVDAASCIGCGRCVESCPVDVLRMRPREARAGNGVGIAVPVYDSDCCVCFLCVDDCPTSAITVASSFAGRRNFRSIYDGDRPDDRTGSGR